MTAELVPKELLKAVIARFDPQRVLLFGSRAAGTAGPDSDIDLLVIVDDDTPPEQLSLSAGFAAGLDYPGATDIIPCRSATFRHRSRIVGTLCHTALTEGVVVHER
jgi:predicted nucleotidyltransferase